MDLLPAETTSQIAKKHGFRSLKLVNVDLDQVLEDKPFGADYGRLDNGLFYYVRRNSKPRMRAALALAVKAGYSISLIFNFMISPLRNTRITILLNFLRVLGGVWCLSNAVTSADETVYELFVPVDKPELLSQAISVLAEFSTEVRVSKEDLEKERGAVMEEYRGNRNASGRMQDAHWILMMEGSKEMVPSAEHAVIAVGDFLIPRKDPPYFSCSAAADVLVCPLKACIMTSACKEKHFAGPRIMLFEVARVRLHGFSEREISIVRALLMAEIESAYLERDQMQSTNLRDEIYNIFSEMNLLLGLSMKLNFKKQFSLVLFTGFSYGGLSEIPESDYFSCSMGSTIAGEIGVFGYRPSVLMDMLAGKRVEVGTKLGAYMRTFSGDCSPSDLETALQLVYQLFTTNVIPGEEDVKIVMQMAEEAVRAQERDPYTALQTELRSSTMGAPIFLGCFKDPSTFTFVIVGNLDPTIALPLILQYLGGVPKPPEPILHFNRDDLKGLPFTFPTSIIREVVRSPMVEAQCSVQLSFPVVLKNGTMVEEIHRIGFLSKLLETKIMQVLRFKHGQIYSAGVSVFLGGNIPSRTGDIRGDISINFSCDPEISWKLVDLALDEILRLQEEGPLDEDVSTVLELEQRAHENGLQENFYWLERILRSYQSRIYNGDMGNAFEIQDEGRSNVRQSLTKSTVMLTLRRILPYPCKKQYTAVILMPQTSRFQLLSTFKKKAPKAIKEIRKFAQNHGNKGCESGCQAEQEHLEQGIRSVPRRVRVRIARKRNDDEDAKEQLYSLVTVAEIPTEGLEVWAPRLLKTRIDPSICVKKQINTS
ncbi:hypothetical protein GH714_026651 [Hevea brasiliensis]|uniref:Peptidase M16 C-terminal domain-containing protein n=1 Tax=Hevea brasiliensis TaxID=3981 RepID=A0A6A6LRH1_HEVBR|nr:hypothetical protein GH714_026651 [Hevea brasiliensis]